MPEMPTMTLTAGEPFSRVIRVVDGRELWQDPSQYEVRADLRPDESRDSPLIAALHDYMLTYIVVPDIFIKWVMTGEQTRELFDRSWGLTKVGYFNIVISDAGTVDARALVVPTIQLLGKDITTDPS